jgi:hypothetical protein
MWDRTKCKPESGSNNKAHFRGLYQPLKLAPKNDLINSHDTHSVLQEKTRVSILKNVMLMSTLGKG